MCKPPFSSIDLPGGNAGVQQDPVDRVPPNPVGEIRKTAEVASFEVDTRTGERQGFLRAGKCVAVAVDSQEFRLLKRS
jgi:hypothetical protein